MNEDELKRLIKILESEGYINIEIDWRKIYTSEGIKTFVEIKSQKI